MPNPSHACVVAACVVAACVGILLTACAGTPDPAQVERVYPPGAERPTRSEAECGAAIDSVRAGQLLTKGPHPTRIFFPPERPDIERGSSFTFELFVDHRGAVHHDSTRITGATSQAYLRLLRRMSERMTFLPAVGNGCAVPGWGVVRFTVNPKP